MAEIGNDALSATWDSLEDGGTVTIRTDGTHDFGDLGPTLLFRQTFEDVEDGGDVPTDTEGVGDVTQATGIVEDAPDLPYGKGQVVDPGTGRYRVSYPERADEFYEHYYIQWPDAHQDAAEDTLRNLEGAGWQVKGIWHFLGGGGYGSPDANDLFSGSPLLDVDDGEPNAWTDGYKITSNSIPTSTTDRSSSGLNGSEPLRWRSEPISKQFWVKCGPENGEAVGSDGMLRNTSVEDGEVAYADYKDAGEFTDKRSDQTGFDRFTCPGYTRGFDYEEGWHPYFSDIYHAVGPGAAARVEVTDSDTYRESNRITVFTVDSWSPTDVQAEVVEGIFHDDTLDGKHLWLTDAENESLYVGQLPEAESHGESEIGFVEAGYGPSKSGSDRPFLNAQQQYTHIVDNGLTEVVRGGIECVFDGGSFEIAMYDVTDGVVGAPRVFKQDVTLPENPADNDYGYEYGTYIFDLDPVGLQDYVGRELAVAVRQDDSREWGQNWAQDYPVDYGWAISTGDRGGALGETWQTELRDSGSARTAALFIDSVDVPDGKARTVVGGDRFGDRSQTVFAAFPEISLEKGMVLEYDERTGADAPVAILPNGVIEVGQGSSVTDSFDVSLRDGDGTWHGPKTVTLVGGFGPVSLTVANETIARGDSATLSPVAEAIDTVTIDQLWTDWRVTVADPDGAATTDDRVSETGEFELSWDAVQGDVNPSITVEPPGDTYVGGTYVLEFLAARADGSATDTALLDIVAAQEGDD